MSLINRMLQDLDARSGGNSGVIVPQAAVRPVAGAENGRAMMIGVVALCVVAAGAGGWYWFGSKAAKPQSPQAPQSAPIAAMKPMQPAMPQQDKVAKLEPQPAARSVPASAPQVEAMAPVVAVAPAPMRERPEKERQAQDMQQRTTSTPSHVAALSVAMNAKTHAKSFEMPETGHEAAPVAAPEHKTVAVAAVPSTPMPAKQVRELTPYQRAENEYRRASSLAVQGKTTESMAALEQALQLDPRHVAARQMLATSLVEGGRVDDAIALLKTGLALDQTQPSLAMALARLQVEKGDAKGALDTLQGGLPYATDYGDYHAFLAALLQRMDRHKEAVDEYGAALRISPQNGLWWMGIGISLQADNRAKDARDAYVRAKASNTLSADLQAFIDQKLAQLQ